MISCALSKSLLSNESITASCAGADKLAVLPKNNFACPPGTFSGRATIAIWSVLPVCIDWTSDFILGKSFWFFSGLISDTAHWLNPSLSTTVKANKTSLVVPFPNTSLTLKNARIPVFSSRTALL